MHWIDWCITIIPLVFVLGIGFYSRRYIRGVVDYLAAGRVAGRYVISVGDLQASLSVITLVALVEAKYQVGYSLGFWENILAPMWMVMAFTGYCVYRFRETKALSIGQFLEMRYNRAFRIFASTIRTISEMLTNAIGPAIAANFFIYFLGLPHRIHVFGLHLPIFVVVVAIVLTLAMLLIWPGGRISLLITDCCQGLICYPIFVLIAGYIVLNFSWSGEIAPVMMDRAPGESFLNPFDIDKLRDFNIFSLVVLIVSSILGRASWIGNDTTISGRTPHEQKMAGILGTWKNGFSIMMCVLISIMIIGVMAHEHFADTAHDIRNKLSSRVAEEVIDDPVQRAAFNAKIGQIPVQRHKIGVDKPLSIEKNLDTPYMETAQSELGGTGKGNLQFQQYRTLYQQMMMPIVLRNLLPVGLIGMFCLLMVMLLLSTDDSRIFNSSSTLVQDVILPFMKKPPTPRQHVWILRLAALAVAILFFFCSMFFVQLDYINMFLTIMGSIWMGGAGPVMIFGLYSRFGTTAGAFASIFCGAGFSISGIWLQNNWADRVYPFLDRMGWVDGIGAFLKTVSEPLNPYIIWEMNPYKFPINSYELYFLSMMAGLLGYIIVSLLTGRQPYNLDRLLHRGKYAIDGEKPLESAWTWRSVWGKLVGITPEYSTGDKILTWSLFVYSFIYQIGITFVLVAVWNVFHRWPLSWWSHYFFIVGLLVPCLIGVVSTVWFFIGGLIDTRRLFRDLAARTDDPLDNGCVDGEVSLSDKQKFASIDKTDEK